MMRAIAALVLICGPWWFCAQAAPAGCARESLGAAVGRYLDALKIGNPALMRLAPGAKYIENRKELPVGEGLLRSGLELDFHRSFLDAEACETFTEIIHTGSHPYVIGTRLKVADGNIAEIESLVTDRDDWLFNAENYLKYSSAEKWDVLPAARRSGRQTLIQAANAYFDVFADPANSSKVPWGVPCERLEGGIYTNPKGEPNPSCTGGPPLQGSVKITNRRFIVDPDMGTVVGQVDFGAENGWPDTHTFRLEDGKIRYVHTLTVCPDGCELPLPKSKVE